MLRISTQGIFEKLIRHGSESNLCPILTLWFNQSEGIYDPFIQYFILRLYIKHVINGLYCGTSLPVEQVCQKNTGIAFGRRPVPCHCMKLYSHLHEATAIGLTFSSLSRRRCRQRDSGGDHCGRPIRTDSTGSRRPTDFCITCGYIADKSALWFCLPAAVIA